MDSFADSDLAERASKKFYTRIRSHLDDLVLLDPNSKPKISEKLKDLPEEDRYGLILQDQLQLVLSNHDKEPDKPVQCDRIEGGSLAKLLFSRASFHNASSTCYLIEDLQINDVNRNSFLGGYSTYITNEENSLAHLRACQLKMRVVDEVNDLIVKMDNLLKKQPVLTEELNGEIDQLREVGGDVADVLVLTGKRFIVLKNYDHAIRDLKSAIDRQCKIMDVAKKNLSDALFHKGSFHLHGGQNERASDLFSESLQYNPENEASQLHLSMAQEQIRQAQRRFGFDANKSFQRRR